MNVPIFYINLDHRRDRRVQIEHELERMGLSKHAERWTAIRNEDHGHIGCYQSHLALLRHIRDNDLAPALILEDDFQFLVGPEDVRFILDKILEMPFFIVNLAYNVRKSAPYNEHFRRALDLQTTAAYMISKEGLGPLIQTLEAHERLLLKRPDHQMFAIDQVWKKLQGPTQNWFFTTKRIGQQRESYSDIEKKLVSYNV
jgi:GR25 family glycosyltransferase involved in LPS biosynthesis